MFWPFPISIQVYIFILVGIVLTGAALGFWMVRKFVISKDGSVDDGVAQFVKWAMRMIASTFILQVWHLSMLIPLLDIKVKEDF